MHAKKVSILRAIWVKLWIVPRTVTQPHHISINRTTWQVVDSPPIKIFHFHIKAIIFMIMNKLSMHSCVVHNLLGHTSNIHLEVRENQNLKNISRCCCQQSLQYSACNQCAVYCKHSTKHSLSLNEVNQFSVHFNSKEHSSRTAWRYNCGQNKLSDYKSMEGTR